MVLSGFIFLATDRCTEGLSVGNLWAIVTGTGVGVQSDFRVQNIQNSTYGNLEDFNK
jgi:hypothetical protein